MVVEETNTVEEETLDMAPLDDVLDEFRGVEGAAIPVLQKTQEIFGYLPAEALNRISRSLGMPLSQLYGVATFYAQFYLTRRGRHTIRVCDGTACHVRGAPKIIDALEAELGIKAGETTADYRATLEVVYCLGSCGLAPVTVIDDQVIGRMVPEKAVQLVRQLD